MTRKFIEGGVFALVFVAIVFAVRDLNMGVVLMVAVSGLMGIISLYKDVKRFNEIRRCKTLVNGKVISVTISGSDGDTVTHEIVVEFFDPQGAARHTKSFQLFFARCPQVGDDFQICYNHLHPEKSHIVFNVGTWWKIAAVVKFLLSWGIAYYFIEYAKRM